jgi:RNA polymerase sigma factor (TIGR02999 family)
LRGERVDHTLNTTALVHEAYLKLVKLDRMDWKNRAHFFAIAAIAMRNVLVSYAVGRKRQKRGGEQQKVSLDEAEALLIGDEEKILAVDEALKKLERIDERQARVVQCRFFGGLSIEETAHVVGTSTATVSRDWMMARAWLARELQTGTSE